MARTKQTVRKLTESNWQRSQQERALPQLVVWKNLTDTDQEQSLCEKSDDIRSQLSCWSESCLSSVLSVKLLRTSRLICNSRAQQSWPCRKPARATWSGCSKTPTCARSMPSELQSCLRISNSRDESVVKELKFVLTAETKKFKPGLFKGHQISLVSSSQLLAPMQNILFNFAPSFFLRTHALSTGFFVDLTKLEVDDNFVWRVAFRTNYQLDLKSCKVLKVMWRWKWKKSPTFGFRFGSTTFSQFDSLPAESSLFISNLIGPDVSSCQNERALWLWKFRLAGKKRSKIYHLVKPKHYRQRRPNRKTMSGKGGKSKSGKVGAKASKTRSSRAGL